MLHKLDMFWTLQPHTIHQLLQCSHPWLICTITWNSWISQWWKECTILMSYMSWANGLDNFRFQEEVALSRFQGGTFDIENKQKARTREEYMERL
jgi:hypothetical protein